MDHDFSPFPDNGDAVYWLGEKGSFVKESSIVQTLTPKEAAGGFSVERLRLKNSKLVRVRGYDNKLPDPDILKAMANHFSSCGEIVRVRFGPLVAPKSCPNRCVCLYIMGRGVKDKAEQLDGSDLGGCKLVVTVPDRFDTPVHVHTLPESELRAKEEANKTLHEAETKRCAEMAANKALPMDHDFSPFPDNGYAVSWLGEKGSFVKESSIVQTLTPKGAARRVLVEQVLVKRLEDSTMVRVRGYDNKLPDPDILKAMANHFSSCGDIVQVRFGPLVAPKSFPNRSVCLYIMGQGVKEKAEQLNGSDLGGCKVVVRVPVPTGIPAENYRSTRVHGHTLPCTTTHC